MVGYQEEWVESGLEEDWVSQVVVGSVLFDVDELDGREVVQVRKKQHSYIKTDQPSPWRTWPGRGHCIILMGVSTSQ